MYQVFNTHLKVKGWSQGVQAKCKTLSIINNTYHMNIYASISMYTGSLKAWHQLQNTPTHLLSICHRPYPYLLYTRVFGTQVLYVIYVDCMQVMCGFRETLLYENILLIAGIINLRAFRRLQATKTYTCAKSIVLNRHLALCVQ